MQEFGWQDVFSPSLTLGPFWGTDLPTFLGLSVGYSPTFDFGEWEGSRHSVYLGLVFGIYVPLFDMN